MRLGCALGLVAVAGCTLSVSGNPDAAPCLATPDFFVSDVYPRYLAQNQCTSRGCHDFDDGHGYLRLQAPEAPPTPGLNLDAWPHNWRNNYLSTIQLLRCDAPLESRLLTVPEGQLDLHPPGPVVRDRALAQMLITSWVRSSP
jgi:hypothetical protein